MSRTAVSADASTSCGVRSPCTRTTPTQRAADHRQPSRREPGRRASCRFGRARAAPAAHRLPLPRSRPARARADAHARARTRTPAAAWPTTSRWSSSATRCSASSIADMLFREFPQHNEGQKSKMKASLVSTASLARLGEQLDLGELPDPRPRRGEDRRPPQAGAARRRLRGADRGDLSRRRHRAGARVHRAPVRRPDRGGAPHRRARGVHRGLQVGAAGMAAVARPRRCRTTASPRKSARSIGELFDVEVRRRRRAGGARRRARARRKRSRRPRGWRWNAERASA